MVGTRKSKKEKGTADGVSCPICKQADNDDMVQCDVCDTWFHFTCAGVDAGISEKDWMCEKCEANVGAGAFACQTNQGANENELFQSPMNRSKSPSVTSKCSKKNRRDREMQLRRLEEEHKMSMLFIKRKYEIMATDNDSDESDDEGASYEAYQQQQENNIRQTIGSAVSTMRNINGELDRRATVPNNAGVHNNTSQNMETQRPMTFHNCEVNPMQSETFLRQDQIYARKITPRELPTFSGKCEEWPLFISSYENSTRMCGFSNEENLLRLQRALKGKALEYVSSKLTLPALVPEVISTLRMLFGRPENIIQNLLTKLRAGPNVSKMDTLVHFSLDVKNIVATMEAANLTAHLCNPMLIQEFVERLPPQMRLDWAIHTRKRNVVNLTEFSDWLYDLAEAASSVITISPAATHDNEKRKTSRLNVHEESTNRDKIKKKPSSESKCFGCEEPNHFIAQCEKFKNFDYQKKWNVVNQKKLCRSCLKIHDPRFCRDRKECGINECTAKHHPLLHKSVVSNDDDSPTVAVHRMATSDVLYRIVPIKIYGKNTSVNEYAFLDEGSGPTLIEDSVLRKLDLKGVRAELCLKWTDGSVRTENESQRLDLKVSPSDKSDRQFLLKDVRSINKLDLPKQTLIFSELSDKYKHLRGLPVQSYENITPKIIIGLNNRKVAMPLKSKEGREDEPAALKTRLGWTVYGIMGQRTASFKDLYSNASLQLHICECNSDATLNDLVQQNMQLENEGVTDQRDIRYDETILQNNVQLTGGKFTVKLLWKSGNLMMPDNYEMALRRLLCFERKLERDPNLRDQVNDHIQNMLKKGYIRILDSDEIHSQYPRKWYLPIFVVKNPNKPGKIRLVWDAAAEHGGVSLNGCLEKGPDLLTPLMSVLFNFRTGKIGITGDISEMFHRVAVDAVDVQSQRFLWRSCNSDQQPTVYVLQVMSFGASCSPSLAQYVKNRNAKDFEDQFPRAAKSIIERHYVDDMLDSVDTVEEAIELAKQVRHIHSLGNFYIRNWMSNSKEVVAAMEEGGKKSESFCQAGRKIEHVLEPEKVLGMWWRTDDDTFTYSLKFSKATDDILNGKRLPTKRELLRLLMSIFDPLGLLSLYTVQMKILLQNIWRSGIEWDEAISEEFSEEWFRWLSILKDVENVKVPRCYFQTGCSQNSRIQLHVFVDASEGAYAAVAYFRIQTQNEISTSLVSSRTKVAPMRPISIPRMELLAALIGARLATSITNGHDLKIESCNFWTDSKTVLQWLRSDPNRYKQFVKFRVAEIQDITDVSKWNYIPSKMNVADLATKWVRQPNFDSDSTWFTGPPFLCLSPAEWPGSDVDNKCFDGEINTEHVAVQIQQDNQLIDYTRFSKWERLVRSMAYVKKFVDRKASVKLMNDNVDLTSEQLQWSHRYLIRLAQSHTYAREITFLLNNPLGDLNKSSDLRKLSPFLDDNMIIRLRGRLENAKVIQDETKNPIILPRNHYITKLIVDWYHRKFKHVHHETVINEIFQKYHITGLRKLLRTVRSQCQLCKNRNAKPNPPEMGPLPAARVSAFAKPFSYVGVDFFGPFIVTVGRRSEKRYGAVFTCLTIRAVHIEMVHSLNTSSCVMAIRNFIARRGSPIQMYSDNGTNLKAAEKELRQAYQDVNFRDLQNEFTTPDLKWTFIPPASPHMGGAWERMVRSIKNVLYQIITPDQKLNDERLYNLFVEVENIINSRPLTYLSLESADQEALTPNHFILGNSSGDKPPGKFDTSDQFLRRSWRHSQLLADKFWKRWVAEVLPTMTRRTNWFHKVKRIEVGDVVIIVDSNFPRHCWPKGIVVETVIGKDGQVRSAVVKTAVGEYHRPAAKIAVLDVKPEE